MTWEDPSRNGWFADAERGWRGCRRQHVSPFEPVQFKLLVLADEAHERCAEARRELKRDGFTIKDCFDQTKRHPAVQIERDSRTSFSKLMRQLKLDLDPPES